MSITEEVRQNKIGGTATLKRNCHSAVLKQVKGNASQPCDKLLKKHFLMQAILT